MDTVSENREVRFKVGPFEMAGQIDYPTENEPPHPVTLIVPGPPQHDRFGNVRGYPGYNNYFVPLVETITKAGYAVFRYDKGGTGDSSSGLSAQQNFIQAYETMVDQPQIDKNRVAILAIGGGSAHVYRSMMQLENINPLHQLTLLSTGVNDLKLEQFNIPIGLIAGAGRMLRSRRALEKYKERTGNKIMAYEAKDANEQLCMNENDQANLFKEDGCKWHKGALDKINQWFNYFTD